MKEQTLFDDVINTQLVQMGIQALVREAHRNATAHGFYDDAEQLTEEMKFNSVLGEFCRRTFLLAQAGRIGQEVGEVDKALRKGTEREVLEELADIVIVTFDLAGYMAQPEAFAHALITKMQTNIGRDRLHGGKC